MSQSDANAIHEKIQEAINSNNFKFIEKIFLPDFLPHLSKQDKEINVFMSAYFDLTFCNDSRVIEYLIFNYQINEKKCINSLEKEIMDNRVIEMFKIRNFNELNKQLNVSNNKYNKKLKV